MSSVKALLPESYIISKESHHIITNHVLTDIQVDIQLIFQTYSLETMKKTTASTNDENRNNLNLPSGRRYTNVESKQIGWKPSIKVGYQDPVRIDISIKDIKIKNQPVFDQNPKPCRKKRIDTARTNFTLKDSLYTQKIERKQMKSHISDVYSKYFKSSVFAKPQPDQISSARSSRNVLPSYRGNNFKQIIEYGNAGKYRSETVTQKCNNASIKSRSMSFADLHEYDFRKRPQKF